MRYVAVAFALFFVVAAGASDFTSEVTSDGFHVDPTVSATDECVEGAVADARSDGSDMYIIVLAIEPDGGATAFSSEMLQTLDREATVFTVAPRTVDYADSQGLWTAQELDAALAASKQVASDNDVVRTFVNELTDGDGVCANSSTDGKSGWAYLVMFAMILGGLIYLIFRSMTRALRKPDVDPTIND